jgi:tellurite resistance protein
MTEDEKKLCVRVLASVAWADGTVSDNEIKHLESEVHRLGYDNPNVVRSLLEQKQSFTEAEGVKKLDDVHKVELLKNVYALADSCGGVSEREELVLKDVATAALGDKPWPQVREWLGSYARFMSLGRKLFA